MLTVGANPLPERATVRLDLTGSLLAMVSEPKAGPAAGGAKRTVTSMAFPGATVMGEAGETIVKAAAALAIELIAAGIAFAATAALEDDRYGFGFALWLVVITMLSPVAWPQFLVCLVPLYVGHSSPERARLPHCPAARLSLGSSREENPVSAP